VNVSCITTDITSIQPLQDTFLYFNFCGIGSSLVNVRKYLQSLPDECSFMISWSNARGASPNTAIILRKLNSALIGRNLVHLESSRKDFVTYFLQPLPPVPTVASSPSPPVPAHVPSKTNNNNQLPVPVPSKTNNNNQLPVPVPSKTNNNNQLPVPVPIVPIVDTIANLKQKIGMDEMKGLSVLIMDGKWKDYKGVFKSWSGTVAYVNLCVGSIALRIQTSLQVL